MLDQSRYWTIIHNREHNLLHITWNSAASAMPEQAFRAHLMRFVNLLRTTEAKKFLVDASAGHFIMLPHVQEWHDRVIVPQYEDMGIQKIAFVYPRDVIEAMSLDQAFDEQQARRLRTNFFDSLQEAWEWIRR
ncbi:MAG: hypothetical protein RMJ87_12430 [Cytophagales bacterium]|nr:hypothetical protein [Bernardetiaceae bacterium]MDW8205827.1 hypothetical protein [Cytophagales bacterium]